MALRVVTWRMNTKVWRPMPFLGGRQRGMTNVQGAWGWGEGGWVRQAPCHERSALHTLVCPHTKQVFPHSPPPTSTHPHIPTRLYEAGGGYPVRSCSAPSAYAQHLSSSRARRWARAPAARGGRVGVWWVGGTKSGWVPQANRCCHRSCEPFMPMSHALLLVLLLLTRGHRGPEEHQAVPKVQHHAPGVKRAGGTQGRVCVWQRTGGGGAALRSLHAKRCPPPLTLSHLPRPSLAALPSTPARPPAHPQCNSNSAHPSCSMALPRGEPSV